jgi:hypothetical protein
MKRKARFADRGRRAAATELAHASWRVRAWVRRRCGRAHAAAGGRGEIRDPNAMLLPVALAEELPVRETAELVERLRDQVGVAVDRVVVNAVTAAPFPPGLDDLDARLAALPGDLALPGAPSPATLAACAAHLRARHDLNARWMRVLADTTKLGLVSLPRIARVVRGLRRFPAPCANARAQRRRRERAARSRRARARSPIVVCVGGAINETTLPSPRGPSPAPHSVLTIDASPRRCARHRSQPTDLPARAPRSACRPRTTRALMLDMKRTFDELVARFADSEEGRQPSSRTASTSTSPTRSRVPPSTRRWKRSSSCRRVATST